MPLLRRLLRAEELGDAPASATAEQLFASSIYSQELRAQRQQAAARCSAPLETMAARRNDTRSELGNLLEQAATCSIEKCVTAALMVTKDGGRVLFLVRDPKLVTKRLAAAVSSPTAAVPTDLAAECLHRVRFRQCRSVYELLCELDRVQAGQDGAPEQLVALGPLCDLFAGFQTASGITPTVRPFSILGA
ncbi:uncharacterized protein IUM83_01698 [Phytophthora cinnamomi]|uniref:uncharacterized protein n=1 Tax=Phytophthora cinnamomi TaxID=4785 RepID=UPI0035599865|nr:hypothetical protein IUM83_01698 [Phytophthora cinnamomi]